MPIDISCFIRSNLQLMRAPCVPEVKVYKAGPTSGLSRLAETEASCVAPYWAYHWAGGLALARHILDRPETVFAKKVLDLGAGSGLVAIAALKAGAASALAADIDPNALAAIALNAEANGVSINTLLGDPTLSPPPDVEVVLVGDLFYDRRTAERLTAFLDQCLASNMDILIGDPWRAFLPRSRLRLLAEYPGADFGGGSAEHASNGVFAFK